MKIKEINFSKVKVYFLLNFDPNLKFYQSFVPNILLYRISQIFEDIFAKNMNGWSKKSKITCIEQSGHAEKNTRKQKFSLSSPSQCKYFPNIFLSPGYLKIFAAVFSKILFNWSPHFITSFSKPVKIQTDSCTAEMGFQLPPIFA